MRFIIAFFLSFLLLGQQFSYADFPIQGTFTLNDCQAYTSIKSKSQAVSLKPGQVYQAVGLNKKDGDFISIKVNGVNKWVNKSCGQLSLKGTNSDNTKPTPDNNNTSPKPTTSENYLLAISWQPAFCETHASKVECVDETEDSYDASNFTLHGLWPDKFSYCGVSASDIKKDETGNWKELPPVSTDAETATELSKVMPGVKSYLDRHEWYKHGTCDGRKADDYFDIAIDLVKEINASDVRALFAQNIGKTLSLTEVQKAYEKTFGSGTAQSMNLKCSNGLATEIRVKVKRPLAGQKLAELLIKSGGTSCDQVKIDPVGVGT